MQLALVCDWTSHDKQSSYFFMNKVCGHTDIQVSEINLERKCWRLEINLVLTHLCVCGQQGCVAHK